jgi:hypothetical protein
MFWSGDPFTSANMRSPSCSGGLSWGDNPGELEGDSLAVDQIEFSAVLRFCR